MANRYPEWIVKKSEERMHDDFRLFVFFIWKHLGLPAPTDIQYDIALYLQTGDRRIIIEAFRGVGKSWITAAFVLWLLWKQPDHKIMVVSASKERADAFSIFCKRLIADVPMLKFLMPRDDQRKSNIAFDVAPAKPDQSPSVKSVGIRGQLTGSRADTIIADDIEIPSNSATETQREQLSELVKEFDAVLKPSGRVIYLGTPQTIASLYNKLRERNYQLRVWPARYPEQAEGYKGALAPIITDRLADSPELVGQPTDSDRFDDLDLREREASYGRSGFALQFMLDTTLSDAHRFPLKLSDLIVMDVDSNIAPVQLAWASTNDYVMEHLPCLGLPGDRYHAPMFTSPEFKEYTGSVMFVDPAGRGKDETAYAVTKMLNGMIFVVRWGGLDGGYDESTLKELAGIAKSEKVNLVMIESNFGDGMFTSLLKPVLAGIHPCTIDEYRVTGQKEQRIIDKLEPALNQHRLVMSKAIVEADWERSQRPSNGELGNLVNCGTYQLANITRDKGSLKFDDRIDILAESVGYWVEQVGIDTSKSMEKAAIEAHSRQLEDFAKRVKKKMPSLKHSYVSHFN